MMTKYMLYTILESCLNTLSVDSFTPERSHKIYYYRLHHLGLLSIIKNPEEVHHHVTMNNKEFAEMRQVCAFLSSGGSRG